jgi:D-alanyl-lipoteichoic acid acyltransferase DltB (MBOAT superfamily)
LLFNSYEFVLLFLPVAFGLFWYGGRSLTWRLAFLTFASYFFYSWWQFDSWDQFAASLRIWEKGGIARFLHDWRFTLVMIASSSVDYFGAKLMARLPATNKAGRRALLALSLAANLGLLAFFKYAGFFSSIANGIDRAIGGKGFSIWTVVLPVGISFYTFESMSYVIDVYRGLAKPARGYLDYACFISFFPHLVAGPIIRWSDILHQFRDVHWRARDPDWEQVNLGLIFFTIGMAKKLLIADYLAREIAPLWKALADGKALGVAGAWAAVLGYTFRIYFDFSGYSDMAVGIGHLFSVRLPQNFDSPYKATDPSDFWRRWHITLSTWLRDYLYFPLGGSRRGQVNTVRNLMITMLLGGLWHGAAWLFVIWGAWHGLLLSAWHLMKRFKLTVSNDNPVSYWANRQITFFLVIVGWVFFRAADVNTKSYGLPSIRPAFTMLKEMFVIHRHAKGVVVTPLLSGLIGFCWIWSNFAPNSNQVAYDRPMRRRYAVAAGAVMAVCAIHFGVKLDFLYFRF